MVYCDNDDDDDDDDDIACIKGKNKGYDQLQLYIKQSLNLYHISYMLYVISNKASMRKNMKKTY